MKTIIFGLLLAGAAFGGSCGQLAINPTTGKLDCIGSGGTNYSATFTSAAGGTSVTAATHGQGTKVAGFCFDNATPANLITQTSGYPTVAANGDIVFAWTGTKTGYCLISSLGGTGPVGATGAAGADGAQGNTGAAGPGYTATSTTSLATAGSGSKTFTTQSGLAYTVGARIRATSAGTGEYMEGVVTSYSTTSLAATMDLNSGTGTHTDWNINLAGDRGATGSTGATGATGASGAVTGGTCTNQVTTAINTSGVPTCTTITSAYVNTSVAQTGVDINTSHQVTATHLASGLPVNQGGTGTTSTLTGLVRGNAFQMTGAELSGDATTSGSNAVTVTKINGTSLAGLATGILKNTTSTGVPSIATAATDYSAPGTNETTSGNRTFTGVVNAAGASRTAPMKVGTSLPGTCTTGDLYFKTDATAGQQIYECSATDTWTQQLNSGGGGGGTGDAPAEDTVSFTATPTFTVTANTLQFFKMTLTGNVTSSTIADGSPGQDVFFVICQDGTGGRTFVWPTELVGAATIDTTASACTNQKFGFDGTNYYAVGPAIVTGANPAVIFPGSTSGQTVVQATATASGTITLPAATDTLVGKATTDTLTNKTFDTAGSGNSFSINGTAITDKTGTGKAVLDTTPTLVTPVLGVATATSVNKVAITAPASSATLTIANGKTATVNNTLTLAGTDSTTMTFPGTSATIARTDAANTFTGHQTIEGVTTAGATGTNNLVFSASPTIVTPTIASFANANHNHSNSAGGGQITDAALSAAVSVSKGGTGLTAAPAQSFWVDSAGCNNATAGNSWDLPTSSAPTPTCYGTSYRFGALDYADAGATTANFRFPLPTGWTGNIDFTAKAFINATSQSVKLTVATVCVAASEDILNPTFNAAQTITVTSPGTANQLFDFTQATVTTTGCAAGEIMIFKVGRDVADTSTTTFSVTGAQVTLRVTPQS